MCGKILIADDEREIVNFIRDALVKEGYEVMEAYDGEAAVKLASRDPDLILLDVMMPGKDGCEVCREIRDRVACPIIFLSALQSESDKIRGLAMGGDDYLTKPFSMKELKVRVEAHLRRERRALSTSSRKLLRFGDLAIDLKGHEVHFRDAAVNLTKKEFEILELLSLHPGMVFSREQIYERIWGFDAVGDSAGVSEHIKKIRSKLNENDPGAEYITTVWGVGYKWDRTAGRKG
ncbi:MAG TPA: response regulator transcription factor [Clostridia bacterium]|nr:response regulator transcription factor [Clostridia bacterium]